MSAQTPPTEFEREYTARCARPSDINEHLPTLAALAGDCDSIAELGVRAVVSTYALMHGMCKGTVGVERAAPTTTAPKVLWMNDINAVDAAVMNNIRDRASKTCNIDVESAWGNDLQVELPARRFDMTFIDTWHVYGQLKRELTRFAPHTDKYIVMHDTTVDGVRGETLRLGFDAVRQSTESGFPVEEITKGLWPAVTEFLASVDGADWKLVRRFTNNNGLTVLSRNAHVARCDSILGGDGGGSSGSAD